ncbi:MULTISPECIES: TIGR00730 family Rossman fold protein [Corynebacterium]|uniref:TIGR00730 family Rossman fold protein n=1 Tax=Corynebacterium TaxID=1716 RepID=UPI00099C3343|nr:MULTISPECIES: TIGR00730 family Rossman fold protein [Corynebacterium]HJF12318.1 TIGR00730 family Rossman fold protein [Corynebacterium falsenii]HJG64912.1 TIGR00730 family Rossman fold protein [Corynebacterium stationis]
MSITDPESLITVSATVIRDLHGRVLCVRKEGSPYFQLPGGKPEAGESSAQAATREAAEEIGVELKEEDLSFLGIFSAQAANEEGFQVRSTVYTHPYSEALGQVVGGQAEIAETRWLDITTPEELDEQLAPLLAQRIGPALNRRINSLTVFTGAKTGTGEEYVAHAREFGQQLADRGITLVYGGGHVELMGEIADGVLESGGHVIGVMSRHLVDEEIAHPGLSALLVVESMAERKQVMTGLADGFVALPGGVGTLDEVFEVWTGLQLGTHGKPVALCNSRFWQPLVTGLVAMASEGFIRAADIDSVIVTEDAAETLDRFEGWQPPRPRWS